MRTPLPPTVEWDVTLDEVVLVALDGGGFVEKPSVLHLEVRCKRWRPFADGPELVRVEVVQCCTGALFVEVVSASSPWWTEPVCVVMRAIARFQRGKVERWDARLADRIAQTGPARTLAELNAAAKEWLSRAGTLDAAAVTTATAAGSETESGGGEAGCRDEEAFR
jgi:hypothetical protein